MAKVDSACIYFNQIYILKNILGNPDKRLTESLVMPKKERSKTFHFSQENLLFCIINCILTIERILEVTGY